jgi:hypothetical protein
VPAPFARDEEAEGHLGGGEEASVEEIWV